MKNEFKKLGAIHAHNSSSSSSQGKRTRKNDTGLEVDLVESDDEPFTLKTNKDKGNNNYNIFSIFFYI